MNASTLHKLSFLDRWLTVWIQDKPLWRSSARWWKCRS